MEDEFRISNKINDICLKIKKENKNDYQLKIGLQAIV